MARTATLVSTRAGALLTAGLLLLSAGALTGCNNADNANGDGDAANSGETQSQTTPAADDAVIYAANDGSTNTDDQAADADDDSLSAIERLRRAAAQKGEDERERQRAASAQRQRENIAATTGVGNLLAIETTRVAETQDPQAPNPNVSIEFEQRQVDLGRIYSNDTIDVEFTFVNRGTEPLVINNIRPSCGCTAMNADAIVGKEFQAGEGGVIVARFTPPNAGRSTKFVTVQSNDGSGRPVNLEIVSEYIPPAKAEPARAALGSAPVSDPPSAETFIDLRDDTSEIVDVTFARGGFFTWSAETVPSEDPMYPFRKKVVFSPVEKPATGAYHEIATITVGHTDPNTGEPATTDIPFTIIGSLTSSLRLAGGPRSQFILVPTVAGGETFRHEEVLVHEQEQPFEVTNVELTQLNGVLDDVEVFAEPVEGSDGTQTRLVITGAAPNATARFSGLISIDHTLESEGPLSMRFSGATRVNQQAATTGE